MTAVVSVPRIVIEVNGAPLGERVASTLTDVRVQQRLSLPTLCELSFSGPPPEATDRLEPGTRLQVRTDRPGDALFVGEVTAVEYVYQPGNETGLRVRAYDPLHRLRKRQTPRAHVSVNVRELAQELAADVGLRVEAASDGPVWQRVIQHRQSDLALLVELAARCGLYLVVWDDVLHLLTLDGVGEAVPLVLGDSLLEARLEANGDPAAREVTAAGWDPLRSERHSGSVSSPRVGRQVALEVPPDQVGGSGTRHLLDEGTPDDGHAEGLAQAELDRRVAGEVTLRGVAEGDARLRAGRPVNVSGVAEPVAGRYVLTSVTHILDARHGFVTEVSSAPPLPPARVTGAGATVGVVIGVDDPQHLGRVRVTLPTYGGVETEWMEVVCPGAGPHKGLVALPDVDDQVLVLLAHEDPGQGVVIGGLYGVQGPPDSGVEGARVQRYSFQTPGGQRIRLDDSRRILRLEDQNGSYIELGPSRAVVHAAVDLVLEGPGRHVLIRGQAIDFESA
jgi:phage protein D/phage baseplate assembly protein gpV